MPEVAPVPRDLRPTRVDPRPLEALADVAGAQLHRPLQPSGAPGVTGVTHDSRAVRPGDLYAALPGSRAHGATFAAEAARRGAAAVLTDHAGAGPAAAAGLPALVVDDPRAVLGAVAADVYGHPARDLLVVGVTGTNGKTTTVHLLDAVLRAAGHRTGLVGTVETLIGDERLPSERTTPEATDLHALFAVMRERGVTACSMEVSSHALVLGRVDGVRFDVAGFTNLTQDHLDFHSDLEDYFAAKASLFTTARARAGVVVVDDAYGRRLARTAAIPVTTVATQSADGSGHGSGAERGDAAGDVAAPLPVPDWQAHDVVARRDGASCRLVGRAGTQLDLAVPLPGTFNVANAALAAVLGLTAGCSAEQAAAGVAAAGAVPGRMQVVPPADGAQGPAGGSSPAPLVVVDYAHTPDAVALALRALRAGCTGRLWIVLGAGGDRDPGKRPLMGAAAARHADVVVVTDDNPRSEPAATVRAAVLAGVPAGGNAQVVEIGDRAEAIRHAVLAAAPADVVLVAGKGHEHGQEIAGTVHPFDDRDAVAAALAERGAGAGAAPGAGSGVPW